MNVPLHLLELRSWLSLGEAAQYLENGLAAPFDEVHLLRLALDGHLPLSVYLPVDTKATEYHTNEAGTEVPKRITRIEGLWDVVMNRVARKQLEHDYEFGANRNFINIGEIGGADVHSEDNRFRLEPQGSNSSRSRRAFPEGSVLAVRSSALAAFIAAQRRSAPAPAQPDPVQDKAALDNPLGERERVTLLTIIAALCDGLKIDITKPSAAGTIIESFTDMIGAHVAARTIEDHLRKIPDARQRRAKTSS
ncbi:MAG TPA: hypothetical protein VNJ02_08985 [Vicinamibacterales bacterium]|nr:hypothetical protein [Vicinamibacterales bacterium]